MPVETTDKKCPNCGGKVLKDRFGLYCAGDDELCTWNDSPTWRKMKS